MWCLRNEGCDLVVKGIGARGRKVAALSRAMEGPWDWGDGLHAFLGRSWCRVGQV